MVLLSAGMISDIRQVADTYVKREIERVRKANEMVDGAVFLAIERYADQLATNAGYSGSYGDGGASALRDRVRFYKMGRDGTFPDEWLDFKRQVERESDPEWAELQRLKKKFGED